MDNKAKIVATIGPSSQDLHTLRKLFQAGLDVARINFSHGTHKLHAETIKKIRSLSNELQKPVSILQDLQGPKIRVGEIANGQAELIKGEKFLLTTNKILGNAHQASIDFADLPNSVEIGGKILLDDGKIELKITSIASDHIETKIINGGILKPHKGVNVPGAHLNIQALTEKDKKDLEFGLAQGVDAIALSFVRSPQDIEYLRQEIIRISPKNKDIPIIAKLEHPDALTFLEDIIRAADGVMVARGDLGVELSPEEVPIAQKEIIHTANRYLKIVITATQMLESMIYYPQPTRAEASDVANAIFDGTDALMLSGETAIGKYPVKSVEMMRSIIQKSEEHMKEWGSFKPTVSDDYINDDAFFVTRAAAELANDRNVSAIAVFTSSGRTARLMSKGHPSVPILAFTPNPKVYNRLNLLWGVTPYLVPTSNTVEEMLSHVEKAIITATPLTKGQEVVLVAGLPVGRNSPANFALIHKIG